MDNLGHRLMSDFVVSRIWADLDLFRPCDLAKLTDVNCPKERLVRQRRKDAAPDLAGKIDHAFDAVGIGDAKTKSRNRFHLGWPAHGEKMSVAAPSASERWPKEN
jgi:hypothetical protein